MALYLLLWGYLGCCVSQVLGGHFMHLGCYQTAEPSADLEGLRYHYARLELTTCAEGCSREGYPYVALQKGKHCLCVADYGAGGLTFGSACTETCNTDKTFSCGGPTTENVYYAVDTDRLVVYERAELVYNTALTFVNARKECVRRNGDLVTIRDIYHMEDILLKVNQSGVREPFWIGLYKAPWKRSRRWTVPNVLGLDASDGTMFWQAGHPVEAEHCVVIDPVTYKWRSASCSESHPYVCHQVPPVPTLPPVVETPPPTTPLPADAGLAQVDTFISANKEIILFYIVIPIFCFCYGGSCVAYTASKAYKNCKRKSRRHAVPSTQIIDQRAAKTRPTTARDVTMNENETLPPPPYTAQSRKRAPPSARAAARKKKQQEVKPTAPEVSQDEEDDVMIDFTKLSIADILYIRTMLGMNVNRTKKKKKICVT